MYRKYTQYNKINSKLVRETYHYYLQHPPRKSYNLHPLTFPHIKSSDYHIKCTLYYDFTLLLQLHINIHYYNFISRPNVLQSVIITFCIIFAFVFSFLPPQGSHVIIACYVIYCILAAYTIVSKALS